MDVFRKLFAILLLGTVLPAAEAVAVPGGIVIYKQFSFDQDSQAEMASYSSLEHFPFVNNVVTTSGQTLRILSSQDPVFIPPPGDPNSTAEQAARAIAAAERRFPQFNANLENVRRAWAAAPRIVPTAAPTAAPILAAPQAAPVEGGEAANVLHTRYGEAYQSWRVIGLEGNTVVISHSNGISRISISDLPDDLTGFPPDVVARAQQLRMRAAALQRAEAAKAAAHPAALGTPPVGSIGH
jgi:hypothetical protein